MAVMAVVMSFTAKAASVTINVDDPNRVSVQLNSVEQTLEAGDNTFELTVGAPTYIYISAKPQMDDLYVNRKTAEQEKESENPQ